jgi:hypothetical protein
MSSTTDKVSLRMTVPFRQRRLGATSSGAM